MLCSFAIAFRFLISYVGRTERNEHNKIMKNWTGMSLMSVIGPFTASSLFIMNAKSAHAHLLHSRHALWEHGCHWISCERGQLGRSHLRATTSSVRRCVKHIKDWNTDIADQPRCGRPRTAATGRLFGKGGNNQMQLATFRWSTNFVMRFVKDVRRRKLSSFSMTTRGHTLHIWPCRQFEKNIWKLLSYPPYSPDLTPSDYHLFGPLKCHLRGHHYETDEAAQEALWSSGTDFYSRGMFKILQPW
jgi:hypothetical protein